MSEPSTDSPFAASVPTVDQVAGVLGELRRRAPLIQCLTNNVVTNWTANVLLAAGCVPAMVDNPEEAAGFAQAADGVLINLGTPRRETVDGMRAAVHGAATAGTPWVLDPVAAGGLPWRTAVAHDLLDVAAPTIVRGNASEVLGLAGGAGGRGPDAADSPDTALDTARRLAGSRHCVVAVSGASDAITDGDRLVRIDNGHQRLTQVTGIGCALGALMAAAAAVTEDGLLAAVSATALLTVVAEKAAADSAGPGSFAVALLDGLAAAEPERIAAELVLHR